MGKIEWDETFQVGVPHLDHRNRQFIVRVNQLLESVRRLHSATQIIEYLSEFSDEADHHFHYEERFLREAIDALEFDDHAARHAFFVDSLRQPFLDSDNEQPPDVEELAAFFTDWLTFHIQKLDKQAFGSQESPCEP